MDYIAIAIDPLLGHESKMGVEPLRVIKPTHQTYPENGSTAIQPKKGQQPGQYTWYIISDWIHYVMSINIFNHNYYMLNVQHYTMPDQVWLI